MLAAAGYVVQFEVSRLATSRRPPMPPFFSQNSCLAISSTVPVLMSLTTSGELSCLHLFAAEDYDILRF